LASPGDGASVLFSFLPFFLPDIRAAFGASQAHRLHTGVVSMVNTKHVDYMNLDSLFSTEELQVRDLARSFVEERILPVIEDCYEQGVYPSELIRPMGELGFYGCNLPEEYGCAGMNNIAYGLITQELERGDSGRVPS
jgi:alkylation response protein AidB-like acyl-CoA dehydrogenase